MHADLPEVFEVRSDGYLYILQEEPGEALHDKVREAADLCPTAAISARGLNSGDPAQSVRHGIDAWSDDRSAGSA